MTALNLYRFFSRIGREVTKTFSPRSILPKKENRPPALRQNLYLSFQFFGS